mmetsp:Transcript_9191/g.19346  ORF Transcript_9191/g.19346 Transcript_9191/m.19346 type:complete len:424 (-) Transcript_9191:892-2163(-)
MGGGGVMDDGDEAVVELLLFFGLWAVFTHLVILLHKPPQNILQRRIILPKESLVNHGALLPRRLFLRTRQHQGFLGTVLALPFQRHAKENGTIQGRIGFDATSGEDGAIDFLSEGAGRYHRAFDGGIDAFGPAVGRGARAEEGVSFEGRSRGRRSSRSRLVSASVGRGRVRGTRRRKGTRGGNARAFGFGSAAVVVANGERRNLFRRRGRAVSRRRRGGPWKFPETVVRLRQTRGSVSRIVARAGMRTRRIVGAMRGRARDRKRKGMGTAWMRRILPSKVGRVVIVCVVGRSPTGVRRRPTVMAGRKMRCMWRRWDAGVGVRMGISTRVRVVRMVRRRRRTVVPVTGVMAGRNVIRRRRMGRGSISISARVSRGKPSVGRSCGDLRVMDGTNGRGGDGRRWKRSSISIGCRFLAFVSGTSIVV